MAVWFFFRGGKEDKTSRLVFLDCIYNILQDGG